MGPTPYDIAENILRKAQEYADRMSVQRNKDIDGIKKIIVSGEKRVQEATEYRDAVRGVLHREETEIGKLFPDELESEYTSNVKTQRPDVNILGDLTETSPVENQHAETIVRQPDWYHGSNCDLRGPIASVLLISTLLAVGAYNKWRRR